MAAPAASPRPAAPAAMEAFDAGLHAYVDGDDTAACDHLARAVDRDPAFAEAAFVLGLARLRLGERDAARVAFEQAAATAEDPSLRAVVVGRLAELGAAAGGR